MLRAARARRFFHRKLAEFPIIRHIVHTFGSDKSFASHLAAASSLKEREGSGSSLESVSCNVRSLIFDSRACLLDFSTVGHVGRADLDDEDPISIIGRERTADYGRSEE